MRSCGPAATRCPRAERTPPTSSRGGRDRRLHTLLSSLDELCRRRTTATTSQMMTDFELQRLVERRLLHGRAPDHRLVCFADDHLCEPRLTELVARHRLPERRDQHEHVEPKGAALEVVEIVGELPGDAFVGSRIAAAGL